MHLVVHGDIVTVLRDARAGLGLVLLVHRGKGSGREGENNCKHSLHRGSVKLSAKMFCVLDYLATDTD